MRKYTVIYKSVLMENFQYAANIAMGFIGYFIMIFVFINLWNYMYDNPQDLIAGYTKEQMIWYVMITEMIWFSAQSLTITRQVATDIRGGNIAYSMNKPYHYTLYILSRYSGEWSIRLPICSLFTLVIGNTMVGNLPHFHPAMLLAIAPCIILGITIHALFKLCISLFSFWIEDSTPFQWIYNKLILVVGTIFPIEIFPDKLQSLFKLTPIYTVCYGPAKLVVDFSVEKCLEVLSAQILYLSAGCMLMLFIYGKGGKKLYVNGG